jgi:hypothetical protein
MKLLLNILIMATAISTIGTAQTQTKYKVITMTKKSQIMNVSADALWEIVGPGFENAGVWSTAVDHSVGSGNAQFTAGGGNYTL